MSICLLLNLNQLKNAGKPFDDPDQAFVCRLSSHADEKNSVNSLFIGSPIKQCFNKYKKGKCFFVIHFPGIRWYLCFIYISQKYRQLTISDCTMLWYYQTAGNFWFYHTFLNFQNFSELQKSFEMRLKYVQFHKNAGNFWFQMFNLTNLNKV